jgi:hypothetical protein
MNLVEQQGDVVAEDADLDVAGGPGALPEHASTTSNESGATVSS